MIHKKVYEVMRHAHYGKESAIHMETLATIFDVSERDIRRIILEINTGKVLCNGYKQNNIVVGSNEGYYMAATQTELEDYIQDNYKRLKPAVTKLLYAKRLLNTQEQIAFDFDSQELEIIKEIDDMNFKLLTQKEMANQLGLSESGFRKIVADDPNLPYIKVGKVKRFKPEDVLRYLDTKTQKEKK